MFCLMTRPTSWVEENNGTLVQKSWNVMPMELLTTTTSNTKRCFKKIMGQHVVVWGHQLQGWPYSTETALLLARHQTTTNIKLNMSFELIICSTVRLLILSLSLVARVANFHADWAIERFVDLDIIVCFHYGLIFNVQRRTTNDLWNESIKTKYVFIFLFCVIREQRAYTAY